MKILLFGEFSGVHNNLKEELVSKGHSVQIFSDGDGFKSLKYDIKSKLVSHKKWYKFINCIYLLFIIRKLIGYDVVQFINSSVFPPYYYLFGIPQLILGLNKKKYLYACGTDPNFLTVKNELEYFPNISINFPSYRIKCHRYFVSKMKKIIPANYSYYFGYREYANIAKPILLPGSKTEVRGFKKTRKPLKILFGVTREDFKGASYIYEALDIISDEFGSEVEISIVRNLPFREYIEILNNTDILIDQCMSYSYGMNAIFSMQKGIIVLSGSEEVSMNYIGVKDCPVINIVPDGQQIANKLKDLIVLPRKDLDILKRKCVSYVQHYHNPERIAANFLKVYNSD